MPTRITQSLGATGSNRKLFIALLTPSWLSGLLAVTVSAIAIIGTIGMNYYSNHGLQGLFNLHGVSSNASISSTSQVLSTNFSASTAVSDIPLFIFWAGVGVIVYSLASNVVSALRDAVDIGEELNYVNVNRRTLVQTAFGHLAIRVVILGVWFAFLRYTTRVILPFVFSITHVSTGHVSAVIVVGYPAAAISILVVCLHIHTILLRGLLLKPRLFSQVRYL
jgi:hypothetical protein